MAYRVLRGIGWVICSVLLVLLVPSSAWPATDAHGLSAVSSRSVDHCGTSGEEPPPEEPHVCVTATETATATATATVTETVTVQGEETCGSGELPPCVVTLPPDVEGWMLAAGGLGVALLAALLVTTWGNSGD